MLAIWFMVPLPFPNPAWTSGSSWFMYCWILAWKFWALLPLCVRWVQLCGSLSILWHCLSLGLEWKLTFSSPVATAGFSKFAGILSAALSQHHLLGFEMTRLEFRRVLFRSNHLILCRPLLLLPSIFPSIRVFSNELVLRMRWPEYWSFSFRISPSNEYSGLISFRIDWFDLLEVQGNLRSLLQHHSSKASNLLHSAFFIVQLSHPHNTVLCRDLKHHL